MEDEMTMELRGETTRFLSELEVFANRKFTYRNEIGILLDQARGGDKMQAFEDAAFFAKFLSKSFDLMRRIGPDGDGYDKLSSEFQSAMEKAATLVKTLVKEAPEETKTALVARFFQLNQESLSAFMQFLRELAWVKNWIVDGKQLP